MGKGSSNINYRINNQIRASKLRVISEEGKQLGILSTEEALKLAYERGLSLVEVAPNADPPVAKIVDFGKFKYQEEKKARKEKRGSKGGETKEVRFSPFIGQHDYMTRLQRVKEFLEDKNKVRLAVVFTRKQLESKSFGYDLLKRITHDLGENISTDQEPKFLGRNLIMVISPKSTSKKDKKTVE